MKKRCICAIVLTFCLSILCISNQALAKTKSIRLSESQYVGIILQGLYVFNTHSYKPVVKGGLYVPTTKKFKKLITEVGKHQGDILVLKYKKKASEYMGNKYKFTLTDYRFKSN